VTAGTYTIRIRDANSCTKDTIILVTEPEAIFSPSVMIAAVCNGATGSILMNASGGTMPYEYSQDGGITYQATNIFTVTAGTYTIRTRDANSCTKDTTII